MKGFNRRQALAFGAAATSVAVMTESARAKSVPARGEGKEFAPGVRRVVLSSHASRIPAYKTVTMVDYVYQLKAKTSNPSMLNDMVCHCLKGELQISGRDRTEFVAKKDQVWSCRKGDAETVENMGTGISIMRVIELLPA